MNPTEFEQQIDKLLIFYRDPPPGSNDIYWKALNETSQKIFEKACDIIIDTHKEKAFPMMPVFHAAITQASKEGSPSGTISSFNCPYCRGIGLTITEAAGSSGIAHPCSCSKGRMYNTAFERARIKSEAKRRYMMPEQIKQDTTEKDPTPDPY